MNYNHLCDLQILVRFACILTLLELIHSFIKFAQMKNVFMCNLVVVFKVCQGDVCNMYCDPISKFIVDNFWAFKSLLEFQHNNIHMCWILNLNSKVQCLAFELNGQHVWAIRQDLETMMPSLVNEDVFAIVESLIKKKCIGNNKLVIFKICFRVIIINI